MIQSPVEEGARGIGLVSLPVSDPAISDLNRGLRGRLAINLQKEIKGTKLRGHKSEIERRGGTLRLLRYPLRLRKLSEFKLSRADS